MHGDSDNTARARLLDGVQVTERRLEVAGVPTALLESGDGPPLLLLHGGIECGGAYWGPVIPRLRQSHHLVIPDVPGVGESGPVAKLNPGTFGAWFAALVRITCREKPILVAHSLLGTLASRFAAERSDLLRQLVIYGTPGIGPYRMPVGLRTNAIRFALRPSERNAERFERWAFFDYDQARMRDAAWFEAFRAYTRARAAVPHVKRTMRQLIGGCTKQIPHAELRRIAVPTSLVWGSHDRFVPLSLAVNASSRFGWPLSVIDRAGHVPHVERPDEFLEEVL